MSSIEKSKHERRKEQNREAQRKFRLKKALVVTTLEEKVTTFENKATALQHKVSELQKDNTALRGQVQQLQDTLSGQKANSRHDTVEATGLGEIARSPNPSVEALSDPQNSPLWSSKDMISTTSPPQPDSTNSTVLNDPPGLGATEEKALFSINPENHYDQLRSLRHVSPPAPATSSIDTPSQDTAETRRLFEDSLDGSDISDVERLHGSSWEHTINTDMQMNQTDTRDTFTPDLPSDSQGDKNGQDAVSSLQLSFPVTYPDPDLPHLQCSAAEWPQIGSFDATTSMCNNLTLPYTEVAPVGIAPESYSSLHDEWSLGTSLFTPHEPFAHRVLPNSSLNAPQYGAFNYAMYYPSLDPQPRQYQNYTFYPTIPLYDPLWAAADIAPFEKSYFGHNLAIT